jgi:hypothetical protein
MKGNEHDEIIVSTVFFGKCPFHYGLRPSKLGEGQ